MAKHSLEDATRRQLACKACKRVYARQHEKSSPNPRPNLQLTGCSEKVARNDLATQFGDSLPVNRDIEMAVRKDERKKA